jgi:hypothetical protein
VGSKLERARNRKSGPEFSRRAPLQEMKQERSAGPFSMRFIDKTRQVRRFEKDATQVLLKKMSLITEERTGSPLLATGDLVATKLP